MGIEATAGLLGLLALAVALGSAAARVNQQVALTARAIERLRLMRLTLEALRADASVTRTAVDTTADSVGYLGHR